MNTDDGGWLEKLTEGGVPQLLLGPAGKAISRLLGGAVEIPATWLEGIAQANRDKVAGRSLIANEIAAAAAALAVDKPEVLDRALNSLLAKEYRSQVNKDEVVRIALEDLHRQPPEQNTEQVGEQFLDHFEKQASQASSEDLRLMFGRILAGEIRKPGTVSPSTLHFVSMIDRSTAELIQRALPHCWHGIACIDAVSPKFNVAEITYLEQAGFWAADKVLPLTFDGDGKVVQVIDSNYGFIAQGEPGARIRLNIAILSTSARELRSVVTPTFAYQELANELFRLGATKFYSGSIIRNGDADKIQGDHEYLRTD